MGGATGAPRSREGPLPHYTRRSAVAALGLALAGCASGRGAASPAGEGRGETPSRRRGDVITRDEMARGQYASAYDVVHTLRPQWLVPRGADTINGDPTEIQVRVDESWLGGVATLRNVAAVGIESIRYVDPVTAAGRWGGDYRNGAIVVVGLAR